MLPLPSLPFSLDGLTSPITLETPLGSDLLFHSMSGTEGISMPFRFKLEVTSERADIVADDLLGASVTVNLELGQVPDATRQWNALVTCFQYLETGSDGRSRYRLTLRPWLWQLGLGADCRIFQNLSVPDIVSQVFKKRGFEDFELSLYGTYGPIEYVVQYRESDLTFVSRLLAREGIYYFFRHEDGKHTLVLADDPQAHEPNEGYSTVSYAADDEHRDQTIQYVRRWRAVARTQVGRYSIADYDYEKPLADLRASDRAPDDETDSGIELYDYPAGFSSFEEGDPLARLRLGQTRRLLQTWVGETNARGLTVGYTFDLGDHPRDDQNGGYLVTDARIRLRGNDPSSSAAPTEEPFSSEFGAISSDQTFLPPFPARKPTVRGPQTATVVGPAGQEIWTDAYGRVKVQFHWDREGSEDENSSCWIRVAQAWAGSGWGAQFIPRIGDEVVVAFLEGDPERPLITGSVYNASNVPPFALPDNHTQSGVRTRSTPGGSVLSGNEIRFEDRMGDEELYVQAERDLDVYVKNDQTTQVDGARSTNVTLDDTLEVGVNHLRTIHGAETVNVTAMQSTTVGGVQNLNVSGAQNVMIGQDRIQTLCGADLTSVTARRNVEIGGDLTEIVHGAVTTFADQELTETVGGRATSKHADHRVVIVSSNDGDRSASLHVKGSADTYASTAIRLTAEKTILITCGQSQITLAPDSITFSSPKLSLVATQEVDVTTAKMTVAGTDAVAVTGSTVTLKSSGANVTLDSNVTVQGGAVKLGSGSGGQAQNSSKPPKTTTVVLNDAQGKPLANRTVVLRFGGQGGPERTVVLDDKGQAVVPGDDSFEVFFPAVQGPKKG